MPDTKAEWASRRLASIRTVSNPCRPLLQSGLRIPKLPALDHSQLCNTKQACKALDEQADQTSIESACAINADLSRNRVGNSACLSIHYDAGRLNFALRDLPQGHE